MHTDLYNKHFTTRRKFLCVPLDDQSRQKEYNAESNDLHNPSTLIYLLQGYEVSRAITRIFLLSVLLGDRNQG